MQKNIKKLTDDEKNEHSNKLFEIIEQLAIT